MIRRSTPCVEGWFGPKLIRRMSSLCRSSAGIGSTVGIGDGMREPSYCGGATIGQSSPCGFSGAIVTVSASLGVREPDRLAAERIVLAQRMPFPVVVHQDPGEVRVACERDSHQVELLAFVPVRGRPDGNDA